VDWGSFLTGVAVTVVGGLILGALFGGPRWYVRRRGRQAKEAAAEFHRRTPIRVGGHFVATELRWNAGVLKRCEEGGDVPAELRTVRLDEWRDRDSEMAGLQAEAPDLWKELGGTYADLDVMRHGVIPASSLRSDYVLRLAGRLDEAAEGPGTSSRLSRWLK
jgi:hypothetical protein